MCIWQGRIQGRGMWCEIIFCFLPDVNAFSWTCTNKKMKDKCSLGRFMLRVRHFPQCIVYGRFQPLHWQYITSNCGRATSKLQSKHYSIHFGFAHAQLKALNIRQKKTKESFRTTPRAIAAAALSPVEWRPLAVRCPSLSGYGHCRQRAAMGRHSAVQF